jgi:hypothetical protein
VKQSSILILTRGPLSWPVDWRPLAIGRLPENDVVVGGDQVSRIHAYVVPTPDGPLLVDRSRHGTWINGKAMRAPWLLAEGDEVRIGKAVFRLRRGVRQGQGESAAVRVLGLSQRIGIWVRRYGPSEILGTVAAVATAVSVRRVTGSTAAGAYAGSAAETLVFYAIMFLRESLRQAHQAGARGRPYGSADLLVVLREMLLEFGVAEAIDAFALRPFCMGLGMHWLGPVRGALAGKVAADVGFYGPVLALYEWRLVRGAATRQADRRRRTTSAQRASA